MRTYELFKGEELQIAERIQQRRYQILVHSCLYYQMDSNIISDKQWDKWATELQILQERYPQISEQVIYSEEFKDWEPSSGFNLPITRPDVISLSQKVAAIFKAAVKQPKSGIKKSIGGKRRLF